VHAREHDLGVPLGERRRLGDERIRWSAAMCAARQCGHAEGAVLVATILNAQQTTRSGLVLGAHTHRRGDTEQVGDHLEVRAGH
jgi:hypothetical protein